MPRRFYHQHGLLILMVVFFLIPFAMRGSRMAIRGMRNEVKDWLPAGFEETKELEAFRKMFYGEAFVAVSWENCTGKAGDERFRMYIDKSIPETPPSLRAGLGEAARDGAKETNYDEELGLYVRKLDPRTIAQRQDLIGNRLGLYSTGNYHRNWGGKNEIWMKGNLDRWYYLLPDGNLYRWLDTDSPMAASLRWFSEIVVPRRLHGEHIATLGPIDGPWYYQNPRRLEADLISSVISGPSLLYDLTKEGGVLEGQTDAALARLDGWLFGPDRQQTCIYVTLSELGRQHLHRIVGRGILGKPRGKLLALAEESGLNTPSRPSTLPPPLDLLFSTNRISDLPMVHFGGPPVDNVAIDEEGQVTLMRLVGLSAGIGLVIAWFSFRSLAVVVMLSFVGAISAQASLAFVGWTGGLVDAVLMSMPSLVYVLGLSGAIHLITYYQDSVNELGFPGSAEKAVNESFPPSFLAAFTTAIGLVSLGVSDIVPIRKFGFYSAWGVMFTVVLTYTFVPAVLALWPPKSFAKAQVKKAHKEETEGMGGAFWGGYGRFLVKYHYLVAAGCLFAMIFLGLFVTKIDTSVQLLKLFDPEHKLIRDYAWLETHLGKLVPMELVVHVRKEAMRQSELNDHASGDASEKFELTFLERLEIGEYIRKSVDEYFGAKRGHVVGSAMLASTFVPPIPEGGGSTRRTTVRNAFSRRLAVYREDIVASDFFRIDNAGTEFWRVSLRLGALNNVDFGSFVVSLKAAVEPVMAAYQYREVVLREIVKRRGGKGFRGAKVLLIADGDKLRDENTDLVPAAKPDPAAPPQETSPESVNQDAIFLKTLASLLNNSAIMARAVTKLESIAPDKLDQSLEPFDCIVRTTAKPEVVELLARHGGAPVVDASDFRFDPAHETVTARTRQWPVSVAYTGLVPVVYKAQRKLLDSLIKSATWAFVSITFVTMIAMRSPRSGMVAMFPKMFPLLVVFGFMGWTNILVDIGTMMTASIALGIADDGTLHFLTWFQKCLDRGLARKDAILSSLAHCGTAMVQTTLIAGLGLSVFGFSTFVPTQRFGILMLALLLAALVSDLVFLPALLSGPMGRVFRPRKPQPVDGLPASGNHEWSPAEPVPEPLGTPAAAAKLAVLQPHDQFLQNLAKTQDRIWGAPPRSE